MVQPALRDTLALACVSDAVACSTSSSVYLGEPADRSMRCLGILYTLPMRQTQKSAPLQSSQAGTDKPTATGDDFVVLLNESMLSPQYREQECEPCGANTWHHVIYSLGKRREADPLPELVVQLLRFDEEGNKIKAPVRLPSGLFVVPAFGALYYLKYIAVHIGSNSRSGHYISFERASPSRSQAAKTQEAARQAAGDVDPGALTSGERTEEAFATWTKYDDDSKVGGVTTATLQVSEVRLDVRELATRQPRQLSRSPLTRCVEALCGQRLSTSDRSCDVRRCCRIYSRGRQGWCCRSRPYIPPGGVGSAQRSSRVLGLR